MINFNLQSFCSIVGSLLGDANMPGTQPPSGAFAIPEGAYSITGKLMP